MCINLTTRMRRTTTFPLFKYLFPSCYRCLLSFLLRLRGTTKLFSVSFSYFIPLVLCVCTVRLRSKCSSYRPIVHPCFFVHFLSLCTSFCLARLYVEDYNYYVVSFSSRYLRMYLLRRILRLALFFHLMTYNKSALAGDTLGRKLSTSFQTSSTED